MAYQPAQKNNESLVEGVEPTSPQYQHKKKLIQEETDRRERAEVAEEWLEIMRTPLHNRGDKVSLCKRMADWKDDSGKVIKKGNVHRLYIGRSKTVQTQVDIYKKRGLKIRYV